MVVGWHHICGAVLNIKHVGTRTKKTAFTFVQVLQTLSTVPSDISSYFTHEVSSVFTISFSYSMPVKVQARLFKFRAQHLITDSQDTSIVTVISNSIY